MNVLTSARGGSGMCLRANEIPVLANFLFCFMIFLYFFFSAVGAALPLKWYSKVSLNNGIKQQLFGTRFLLPICYVSLLWHLLKYLIPFKHLKHLRQAHTPHAHTHPVSLPTRMQEQNKNENEPKYYADALASMQSTCNSFFGPW